MQIECGVPDFTSELGRFWLPYKQQAPAYLNGHRGYACLAVPRPEEETASARLHVAVCFADIEEMDDPRVVEHRQDFDRLMDIVQQVVGEMVEASLLFPGRHSIDIIAEPLTPGGALKPERIDWMSFAIGATWLAHQGKQVFKSFRRWDPETASWLSG